MIGKCLTQQGVIRVSPRVLRPPFWSSGLPLTSRDLLGHLLEPPGDAPEAQKSTRLDKNHKNVEFQKNTSEQQFLASGPCSTPPKSIKSVLILFAKCFKSFGIIFKSTQLISKIFLRSSCDMQFWRKSHPFARTRSLKTLLPKRKAGNLTGKCLNRKVVIKASPRALRPPFWSSGFP